MAYLIEETKGAFPVWLAPVQIKVLPVSEKSLGYAGKVYEELRMAHFRVELDERNEKIGYKIRSARQDDKVPYMVIIGEKESEEGKISVRDRATDRTATYPLEAFAEKVREEIQNHR